ncbi:DinB family protein [Pseudonocardia sp. GCM10023141]|uniref:DinB family protein n=1 Tax=Pseudonocardia sp. GCM10023141 TaxID=3252653 RepID=UPI003624478A
MSLDRRTRPAQDADERTMLAGVLEFQRETLARKCEGLSPGQLAERAVAPSPMSLLGLIRHVTDVERGWFQRALGGLDAPPLYYDEAANPDGDFDDVDAATVGPAEVDATFATWRATCARSHQIYTALPSLEATAHNRGRVLSARWVLLHLIEEYARHNGHADLLRERIDGVTGE